MNNSKKTKRFYLILVLGLLTAIGPFSIDMYLPAFPDIARDLDTTIAKVMLSLSSFFIGISVGQLIYGPMLERFGRKKPLYAGLIIYLLASIGCVLATSVDALIFFRLLQALGGCAGMVAARAIVRDLFEVKDIAKIFSMLMLVVAVSPIVAPTAGGYITATFGWHSVFIALIIISILIIAGVYFLLPNSKEADPGFSLKPSAILKNFASISRHPQFYTYALTGSIANAGLYAYISGSPFVFMELFKVSEKQYGWIFAMIAVGIISASQVNNFVLKRSSSEKIVRVAVMFQTIIGITLASLSILGISNLFLTIVLIFSYLACQGFIFPNASALCLSPFGHTAGSASALMGAIQMGIGAATSAMVSVFQNNSSLTMTATMASCSILAFAMLLLGRKLILQRATLEEVEEEDVEMISTL